MSDLHAHFEPLRRPSRAGRAVLLLAGALLWPAALIVVSVIANETNLIWYGLVIAGGSLLVGIVLLGLGRARRVREEREPGPRR